MNRRDAVGAALCVLGMTILGSSVPISRLILGYPVLTGQALRYALAAALLAALVRVAAPPARPAPRDIAVLTALAATGLVLFNVLLLTGLRHADAPVVGTVVGAAPLGLALLGPLLAGRRPATRLVAAAGVVVAGTALVHGAGRSDRLGLAAAVGTLACEVAFSLFAAAVLPRLGALRVSAWSCALAVPLLLAAALATGEPARWRAPTGTEAGALAFLAVMLTVGAFLAWFTGLNRLGVERAGMFVGLLPVATLVATALQDGRPPGAAQAAGVLVVAAGLTLGLLAHGTVTRPVPQRPVPGTAPHQAPGAVSPRPGPYGTPGAASPRSVVAAADGGRSAARTWST